MTNEELKLRVGSNIAALRKQNHMTQAELAERLNYSDKAVSKWERGESMPDVMTLMLMAEQFGTDMNALVYDREQQPAPPELPAPEPIPEPQPEKKQPLRQKLNQSVNLKDKGTIQTLSSVLVWVVALFIYLVLDSFQVRHSWMTFVLGVIANAIVLLSLRSVWRMYGINRILVSVIMWGTLIFFYLVIWLGWQVSVWRVFLLGLLGQAAILLWFKMFRRPDAADETEENSHE